MKVILLKGVQKLGKRLDIVEVSEGFAMNSLFPKKLAELATKDAITRAQKVKASEEAERAIREDLLIKNLKSIEGVTLELTGKANAQGHLFAGIHKEALVPALKEAARIEIDAEYILLDKPLKEVGEHVVEVKVQDKKAQFTVSIKAE
jgi:large subunit ribosomal protein L9